ncbi:MAG: flagellar biosynthesis anti-sigma factor FlgM [Vicinamibacterales bacterium]
MRIDNNRANFDRIEQAKTEAVQTSPARGGRAGQAGGGDQVSLSAGVQLASSAATAAAGAPDLRRDKVERAKALLESGQLGIDPHKLADRLIDRAITNDD